MIRFFVPGKPKSTQTGGVWRHGSRAVVSRMNQDWADMAGDVAALAMREAGLAPFEGPVSMGFSIIMPRRKDMRGAPPYPDGGPDLDNAMKGLKDAWQGIVYQKDSQVKRYHRAEKVWAAEGIAEQAHGGIAVDIYSLAPHDSPVQ